MEFNRTEGTLQFVRKPASLIRWSRKHCSVYLVFLLGALVHQVQGQSAEHRASPYFNIRYHYRFIDYALNSETISLNHILSQPFSSAELLHAIDERDRENNNKYWFDILKKDLNKYVSHDSLTAAWNAGVRPSFSFRRSSELSQGRPRLEVWGYYSLPYFVLYTDGAFDQNLKDDPDFYGRLDNILIGRMNDAYVQFKYRGLQLFGGRLSRNLGTVTEPSLVFSSNPFSFDLYGFDLAGKFLKFSFYFTRLNDIFGFDIQEEEPTYRWTKRFFYLHRLELSLSRNLGVAVSEMVINGGERQGFLPFFLNPANLFRPAERNQQAGEEKSANILYAAEAYWKPTPKVTIYGQFLLDDIDFTKELREEFPDRLGYSAKLVFTDLFADGTQIYAVYNRIDNWTYISFKSWENYIYHGKSIGFPNNAVENIKVGYDHFGYPPFIFSSFIKYERLGEQDWATTFDNTVRKFPRGVVQQMFNINLNIEYFRSTYFYGSLALNWFTYDNFGHTSANDQNDFTVSLSLNLNVDYRD